MRRSTALRAAVTIIVAVLVALLLPSAGQEAAEGRIYTLLAGYRPVVEADSAIVLIETPPEAPAVGPGPALGGEFFLVLAEMGAEEALLTISRESADTDSSLGAERNIRKRFETEFGLIKDNVAALFDAIRFGSVRPQDAEHFIDELLTLVDNGGNRLMREILSYDENSAHFLENARRAFGEENIGVVPEDLDYVVPQYEAAFAVPEYPVSSEGKLPFLRLPLEIFHRYGELEKQLEFLLESMEKAGYFTGIRPEQQPTILHDHVQELLAGLLSEQPGTTKKAWLDARVTYFQSIDALLTGGTETLLDDGIAAVLTLEQEEEEAAADANIAGRIEELRQNLAQAFTQTRETFAEFSAVRNLLARELDGSSCVVGIAPDPQREPENVWKELTAAETAAARIHSIRLNNFSVVLTDWKEKAAIAAPGILFAALLGVLSLPLVLLTGFLAVTGTAAACMFLYINTGVFVHPVYAALVPGTAIIASLASALPARAADMWQVLPVAGFRFPGLYQRLVAAARKAPPAPLMRRRSVILAVRFHVGDDQPVDSGKGGHAAALRDFHESAGIMVQKHNGVILGAEGPVLFAGFGTPFDRYHPRKCSSTDHVRSALHAALGSPAKWSFGLDIGECTFYLSPVTGYSVEGSPVVYARSLSRLTTKYDHPILMTKEIVIAAGDEWPAQKLHSLLEKSSGKKREFYALITPPGS